MHFVITTFNKVASNFYIMRKNHTFLFFLNELWPGVTYQPSGKNTENELM